VTAPSIRRTPLRGHWYPAEPEELRALIGHFLSNVPDQPLDGKLHALVSPHAGYPYSGQTAAHGYKQVSGRTYEAVIVLGPSHFAWVGDYALSYASAYDTPLGAVPVAGDLVEALNEQISLLAVREGQEHSIELQLPFLQTVLGGFALVPFLMSADTLESCVQLGEALAELMRRHNLLLVASSDLNHLESYREVVGRDADVRHAVEQFDLARMAEVLLDPAYTVCGRAPILTAAAAAQALGANRAQVLSHTNSGDVTGRKSEGTYTVGYMSAAFVQT
jgi:AmmeMemoRadiSam system protein B